MLGLIALVLSLAVLLSVKLVDRFGGRVSNSYARRIWSSLHESLRAYVVIHLACVVFIAVSASVAIAESKNEPLIEAYSPALGALFWSLVAGYVLLFARERFRSESDRNLALMKALEETVDKAPSPKEGMDHVLTYIREHPQAFPEDTTRAFLTYISKRNDVAGEIARTNLKEN